MIWTQDEPTRPGWWWRKAGHRVEVVRIVWLEWKRKFFCLLPGGAAPRLSEVHAEAWGGPIDEPGEAA
jgi:hypothetical protein